MLSISKNIAHEFFSWAMFFSGRTAYFCEILAAKCQALINYAIL